MEETLGILHIIGILSAIIFIIGDIPYFRDTLSGNTQPHRVTWGVVFLLNIIAFSNQYASGADNSLWMFGAVVFATGAIFLASLKNGVGGHTKGDLTSLFVSLVGVVLWIAFSSPALSIFANVVALSFAVLPTLKKAKKEPESETRIAYLLGGISSLLGAISVGKWSFELLALPLFGIIVQTYLVYLLYIRPNKTKKTPYLGSFLNNRCWMCE